MYKIPAKTLFIGKKLVFLTSCHSTSEEAYARIGKESLIEGTVFITNEQTRGRGQMGNMWESEPGMNLTLSVVLKPGHLAVNDQFRLTQAISLSILDTLQPFGNGFSVKWPNDIYFHDRKICGILVQNTLKGNHLDYSVIGIGLNINQKQFKAENAISLAAITKKEYDLDELFSELMFHMERRYLQLKSNRYSQLHQEYLQSLYRFGEDHLYRSEEVFTGRIIDVRPGGELVMETRTGERDFRFKEVVFLH